MDKLDAEVIETKLVKPQPHPTEQLQEKIRKEEEAISVLGGFVSGAMVLTIGYSLVLLKLSFIRPGAELTDYALFVLLATLVIMLSSAISLDTMRYIVLGGGIGLAVAIARNRRMFLLI
jgi:hypothetical protein